MPQTKEEKAAYQRRYKAMKRAQKAAASPPKDTEEEATLSNEDAEAKLPPSTPDKKKVGGEVLLSQQVIVKLVGSGIGWISARAFGPENAMTRTEAQRVAFGGLRIIGRHFFKNIDMAVLAQTDGDLKDAYVMGESLVDYVTRRMEEREKRKAEAKLQGTPATQAAASPLPVTPDETEEALAMPSKPFNGTIHVPAFMGSAGEA